MPRKKPGPNAVITPLGKRREAADKYVNPYAAVLLTIKLQSQDAAAEQLGCLPETVSAAIDAVEDDLGVMLMLCRRGQVYVTPAGEAAVPEIRRRSGLSGL